ncbi:MAG: glycosyltransferase, partial [Ginsengibacter sp.]
IIWIQMNYNSGFARANNEGIRQSTAPVILLLNPDTLPDDNSIEKCYFQLIQSEYVACGVQLLNQDGTPQISGNYFMKGGLNHLLPLPYLGIFFRWIAILFKVKKPNVSETKIEVEVDWINGAFLMVKRMAIIKAGLLDEDFFLYAEEAEWCSRLQKNGKLCIYGNINIVHLQGETANETFASSGKGYKNVFDRKGLQLMLSNVVRIRKQFGVAWFLFILTLYVVDIPVFFIGYILTKLFFIKSYTFKSFQQYTVNIFRLLKFTFKIVRNEPFFYKVL